MSWSVTPYDLPLAAPYQWARGSQSRRRGLLVGVEAGASGWGEVAPPPDADADLDALADAVRRLVRGLDPASPRFLAALDARAPEPRLRCGIATAHLDAGARRAGVPLADHLGGGRARPDVPVNALVTAASADEAAQSAAAAAAAGFATLKIKCTADRPSDVARVAAVREAAPKTTLRLDANGAWDAAWAAPHIEDLLAAARRIEYVEQPLPPGDLAAVARLCGSSPVPVALDEDVTGPSAVQRILEEQAADVLVLKPQRLGGPDRTVALARFAAAAGLPCVVTQSLETAIGRAAALHAAALLPDPPACGLATGSLLAEDVAHGPTVANGRMRLPDGPGLGVAPEAVRAA